MPRVSVLTSAVGNSNQSTPSLRLSMSHVQIFHRFYLKGKIKHHRPPCSTLQKSDLTGGQRLLFCSHSSGNRELQDWKQQQLFRSELKARMVKTFAEHHQEGSYGQRLHLRKLPN